MYAYNESNIFDPNAPNIESNIFDPNAPNQAVPNMLEQDVYGMGSIQVQEGANMTAAGTMPADSDINGTAPQPVPIYAVDYSVQQFEIPDPIVRRNFVRSVFSTLLMQQLIMLAIVEIFIVAVDEPLSNVVYGSIALLTFVLLCGMYIFSDIRRHAPMNVVAFVLVTLLIAAEQGVYATMLQSQMALIPIVVAIVQLFAVIAYSKQTRFKFSNINAILFILLIFIMCALIFSITMDDGYIYMMNSIAIFRVMYFVYDMQLMLSGHHGYNLQPGEHLFAATNMYADMPNLIWRFLRYIFITPVVNIYRFFMSCCFAEVC